MSGKNRIIVEKDEMQASLPMSDARMMRLKKPSYCDIFLPLYSARCLTVEAGGLELREKLPPGVWIQEMNLLAFILQKFDTQQMEQFQKMVLPVTRTYPGELINYALAICPEAAGFERGDHFHPQYTGENLFDLMEYKRFQDWRQEHASFQIAKFYFPVEVSWKPEHSFSAIELTPAEAVAYQPQISEMIARCIRSESCWSDWEGYDRLFELTPYKGHGLLYERPDVEIRNGELWGVIVAGVSRKLTEIDKDALKDHFDGGIWEGWGEHSLAVQVPGGSLQLFLSDCTEVFQQAEGELVLTEREMFCCQAPHLKSRLSYMGGWEPDFRGEREYGKEHAIWLELLKDRRRVRIPLLAEDNRILEEIRRSSVNLGEFLRIRIKTRDRLSLYNGRVSESDIPVLNQIGERIQGMHGDRKKKFYEILLDKKWGSRNRVQGLWEILEAFSGNGEGAYEAESMGMEMGQL